jgi:deoxyribose-phosphate aldolase
MKTVSPAELARHIEHTLTRPDATRRDIEQLCAEARQHGFYGVCVNGSRVELACALLEDAPIKVTGLVGFPLGAADADVVRYEAEVAVDHGAHEIEMVLNVGRVKDGDHRYVLRELRDIAEAADERPVKVILEMGLLTPEETLLCCALALDSGVHSVCTSGAVSREPALEEIAFLREAVGEKFGVKACGRILEAQSALALLEAGATRLGTRHGVAVLSQLSGASAQTE